MSIEELLKSTFGARFPTQIDQLFEAVKSEKDNRRKAVQILKSTRKDEVLTYFINQGGLGLIHEWLTEWTAVDSASKSAIEAMKLLRQLPVTEAQLRSNKNLCQLLSRLKKSGSDAEIVEIAGDVVDLWKKEGGAEVVFRQGEDPPRRDADAIKTPVAEVPAKKPSARDTSREREKSASKAAPLKSRAKNHASSGSDAPGNNSNKDNSNNSSFTGSATSSSRNTAPPSQNLIIKEASGSTKIGECSAFAAAMVAIGSKSPAPRRKGRQPKNPAQRKNKVTGEASFCISEDDVGKNPVGPPTVNPGDEISVDAAGGSSKKRVRWKSEIEERFYYTPLSPLPEEEVDVREAGPDVGPFAKKRREDEDDDDAVDWREFWRRPEALHENVNPMPFIQPGSQSVEKRVRESPMMSPGSWDGSDDIDVMDLTCEVPDYANMPRVPKEIPLEPVNYTSLTHNDTPQSHHPYSLFPSPPYYN